MGKLSNFDSCGAILTMQRVQRMTGLQPTSLIGLFMLGLMSWLGGPPASAADIVATSEPAREGAPDADVAIDAAIDGDEKATVQGTAPLGKSLPEFALQDHRGREYCLSDFEQHPLLVVTFLGTECPLAKLYGPRLARLADEFAAKGVGFVGVNANAQDSLTELAAYARQHHLKFPLLKDVNHRLADQLGALRTPEVFVVDRDRRIRYRGRIDDQYGVGYARPEPQRHDLQRALEELLAGQDVSIATTPTAGCLIGRVRERDEQADVTYSNQIVRILQQHCLECHRDGEIAPFALDRFEEVAGWSEMIEEVVRENRMPPWHASAEYGHFINDRQLTDAEKRLIYQWVAAGAPQGDPQDVPPASTFTVGWQLTREPDLVVAMSDEPQRVPAEGSVEYLYFKVDPQLTEDQWIEAVEVVPGNRAVVHHVLVFADSPGDSPTDFGGGVRGFLAGYVPGLRAVPFPPGMAKLLPAGSNLIFQIHYTPIGSEQTDVSKIGFVFTTADRVTHEVKTISAFQPGIRIPRGADDHRETSKTKLHRNVKLLAMNPHMHLRGKSFRYLLRLPGQDAWTTLLDVPGYDFNWQTNYRLAEPLDLPEGSFIKCIAHYDNSADNPHNPDPERTVRWGDQTWDEMMIGYFDVAVPLEPGQAAGANLGGPHWRAEEFILQMDQDDDFELQLGELPPSLQSAAQRADINRDGRIGVDEVPELFRQR
jgi:peroxiredoxin